MPTVFFFLVIPQNGLGELRTNLKRAKEGKPPVEGSDGKKPRNLDPNA